MKKITCREYLEACQFQESKGWQKKEISLADFHTSSDYLIPEFEVWVPPDEIIISLYREELVKISDPENYRVPYPIDIV